MAPTALLARSARYRYMRRLSFLSVTSLALVNLVLCGCGTNASIAPEKPRSITLSATPTTLLPGQTALLAMSSQNVSTSTISVELTCSVADCGSLSGDKYHAPHSTMTPLNVKVTAYSSVKGVPPSFTRLAIVPPPSISGISPSTVMAGTSATLTVTGNGFMPSSTLEATTLNGLQVGISQIKVLSGTSIRFVANFPLTGAGAIELRVSNPTPAVTSPPAHIYVEPSTAPDAGNAQVFDARNYGASGSDKMYQCSGDAGSFVITCDEPSLDFVAGEGIRIVSGGIAERNPAATNQPVVTPVTMEGPTITGPHSDCYVVYATDALGGISAPSPRTCVADQPTLSFSGTFNSLQSPYSQPFATFLWYVSEDGGPYQLLNVEAGRNGAEDMEERVGSYGGWPSSYSTGSSGITKNDDLFTIVAAVHGNQITLQQPLTTSVTDTEVDHDDTNAIQAAINAAVLVGGGVVKIGKGHFNVRRPMFWYWTPASGPYPVMTTDRDLKVASQGYTELYIPDSSTGHITIEGSGTSTVLQTPPGSRRSALLSIGYYSRPAYSPFKPMSIEPLAKGDATVTLANAADSTALHPGDDVWLYTGSFGGNCPNRNGTAGGQCHFSELNTIQSLSGSTLTLKYPVSKRYYDDGENSFGMVKLPVTPHDVTVENMTIDTNDPVIGAGMMYGLLINDLTVIGSPSGGAFAGGFKRDVVIENSSWSTGESNATWDGTEEFDQFTGIALIHDQITGHSAPGSDGPSMGARLYFTEGTSQVLIKDCTFNHISVYFQDTTDDVIDNNTFNDADVTVGNNYNEYKHPLFWGGYQDDSVLSFDSQDWSQIDDNIFNIGPSFFPPWIVNIGHFKSGQVDGNTINNNSAEQNLAAINSDGGEIEQNIITLGPNASSSWGIAAIPDEGPNFPASGFTIENNTIVGPGAIDGIYVVDSGFTNTAPVCIKGNSITISKGTAISISRSSTNLTCNDSQQ